MKLKIIEKNISRFRLTPKGIVKLIDFKEIILNDNSLFISNIGLQELYYNNNLLYTNNDNGEGLLFNLSDKSKIIFHNEYIKQISNNFIVSFIEGKTKILNTLSQESVFYPYKILKSFFYEQQKCLVIDHKSEKSIIFSKIKNPLSILSFPLSTLGTWHDGAIEKPYQVAEFSGIYENTLVCTMTNGDLLLLDIQTGEVKFFLKNCIAYNLQQIDDSPIFCGLYGYSFVKINATTGEILNSIDLKPLWKELGRNSDEHYVYIGVCIYHNGLLYFLNRNTVGIFDPSTCKIIDFQEFEFDCNQGQQLKGGKENLQVKDGKIYCLDTLGNLYELESNAVK